MRNTRNILLLILAACLALAGLVAPFIVRGLAHARIEWAIVSAGGQVAYDSEPGWTKSESRIWLAKTFGRHFAGNMASISLERCTDTALLSRLLTDCRDLESLRYLSVNGTAINQACVERIGHLRSLEKLVIDFGVDVSDLSPLANLPHLKSLSLASARQINPAALAAIAKIPALDTLDLTDSDLQGSSLSSLGKLRPLTWLQLSADPFDWQNLDWLAAHPDLFLVVVGPVDGEEAERIRAAAHEVVFRHTVPAAAP